MLIQNLKKKPQAVRDLKISFWNELVDSDLSEITQDDCSIYPRVLPASYLKVIEKTARDLTEMLLRLVHLPAPEIKSIFPSGPNRDFLIENLQILKHRQDRITGSLRFDMAVVGEPSPTNPPKLLEVNEIGFDGLCRYPFIQELLCKVNPSLKKKYFGLDTTAAEIRNMKRRGRKFARFQGGSYNWDEELLLRRTRQANYDLRLISPQQLQFDLDDKAFPLLKEAPVKIDSHGRLSMGDWNPDMFQISYALELEDYLDGEEFYAELIRKKATHYGSFLMGLVATKAILVVLNDPQLQKKLMGSSNTLSGCLLPAWMLEDCVQGLKKDTSTSVLKFVDGFGGYHVFMDADIKREIKKIKKTDFAHWIVQQRTDLNTFDINGILSKPRVAIGDLGVFVHYDWYNGKMQNFELGGFLSRATNKSLKVNVSGGGAQVAVMFEKGK